MTPAAFSKAWTDYAQSLRLWVVEFMIWLAAVTQWRDLRLLVRSDLRFLRREVRDVLVARMAVVCHKDRPHHGRGKAHWQESSSTRRRFRRYVLRGVVLRTFADAKRVLDELEIHVASCIANFRAGMKCQPRTRKLFAAVDVVAFIDEGPDSPDSS